MDEVWSGQCPHIEIEITKFERDTKKESEDIDLDMSDINMQQKNKTMVLLIIYISHSVAVPHKEVIPLLLIPIITPTFPFLIVSLPASRSTQSNCGVVSYVWIFALWPGTEIRLICWAFVLQRFDVMNERSDGEGLPD